MSSNQVPIADFYAVPLFNPTPTKTGQDFQAARANYRAAHGGVQAPPFNPSQPVQLFDSPGSNPVPCFDPANVTGGYVDTLVIATPVNIPGSYNYPPYVIAPTVASWQLGNVVLPVPPNYITDELTAQAMVALLQLVPAFAGHLLVLDSNPELPAIDWGTETRRFWHITVKGVAGPYNAAQLAVSAYSNYGVGYPGQFNWSVEPGNATNIPSLWWQNGTPSVGPKGAYVTVPVPIYPIPDGWQIAVVNRTPFSPGQFVVQPVPSTAAAQAAVLQEEIANMQTELQSLQSQPA